MAKQNVGNFKQQIDAKLKKFSKAVKEDVHKSAFETMARATVDIVVKRTRLGYGVSKPDGQRHKLEKLTKNYIKQRRTFSGLDSTTEPSKSNLTRTGQMLRAVKYKMEPKRFKVFTSGTRDDGKKNEDIAEYNAKRKNRIFLNLSNNEFKQLVRIYRRSFTDLIKKLKRVKS